MSSFRAATSSALSADSEDSIHVGTQSSGNSSTCSSPYWKYFDSVVLRSNQEIQNESKFIGETSYFVKNFEIYAGISVARGLMPSIKISSTRTNLPKQQVSVSFDESEWFEFLEIVIPFLDSTDEDTKTVASLSENFTVSTILFLGERLIKLYSREVFLYLCLDDIRAFLNVKDIVHSRLSLLQELDFRTYYDQLLNYYNISTICKNNCLNAIKEGCKLNISELSYFMLEFIHLNPNKVFSDFNNICNH